MPALIHPDFALVEGGRRYDSGQLSPIAQTVVQASEGVAAIIRSLSDGVYIVRDPASPAPSEGAEGRVWLQTSGTTGTPKWAGHRLGDLKSGIQAGLEPARWLLTFNPGSFAGLQVMLSAMAGGHVLIAPPYGASVGEMADLAVAEGATHISGTPPSGVPF